MELYSLAQPAGYLLCTPTQVTRPSCSFLAAASLSSNRVALAVNRDRSTNRVLQDIQCYTAGTILDLRCGRCGAKWRTEFGNSPISRER